MFNVIVVDDDPANTTLLKMLLEMDGFTVTTSADIEGAKANTDSETAAFLIDCHLARGKSGLDLVRDIRQGQTAAAADAVVLVTSGDYRQKQASEEAGANRFLLKPYPPETLSSLLLQLLNTKDKNVK